MRTIEDNLGIDENGLGKSILPFTAHHDQLNRSRHLGSCQANSWFIQHRLNQIVDELLHLERAYVLRINLGRNLAQDGITELRNRELRHGAYLSSYRALYKQRDERADSQN